MSADGSNYNDALVVCSVKSLKNLEENLAVLDLPFPIFFQYVVCENKIYDCYPLPLSLVGKNVLANIHFMISHPILRRNDTYLVSTFDGIISNFQQDLRVKNNWTLKKEDAWAKIDPLTHNIIKYLGPDKDELVPFCVSSAIK